MADKTPDACPVDHKAREAWLAQARAIDEARAKTTPQPACPIDHKQQKTWSQTFTSYLPWSSSPAPAPTPLEARSRTATLAEAREISSIPRATSTGPNVCPVPHGASANAEIESGQDASGNWVYPSEKMFFDAMKRKGYDARSADMKTVVPIHNAVNERAWAEISKWEEPYLAESK